MQKPNSKANPRRDSKLQYSSLEPRMMLSANVDAERNLVINGDFETEDASAFIAFADGDQTNVQTLKVVTIMTDHARIVELDSVAGQMDSIAQDVMTSEDGQYLVSFDLRGRPLNDGSAANTNDVEVLFDGENVGVFTGIQKWQNVTIAVSATSNTSTLEFREVSADSDGRGILLDNIAVVGVQENELINGSFEEIIGDLGEGVTNANVPGVNAIPNSPGTSIGVTPIADAADGVNVLNLNLDDARPDRVFQRVATESGARYFVSFELRNSDPENGSADLRVRWNSEFAGRYRANDQWQNFGILVDADVSDSTLVFREANTNTASTVQIDNVRVFRVDSIASDFVLDLNGAFNGIDNTSNYVENGNADVVRDDFELTFNNGSILTSATARISDFTGSESLDANVEGTNISANFNSNNGILRLVGQDSVEAYQQVLRSLKYNDSNDSPEAGEQNIIVSVTDGTATSMRPRTIFNVVPVNDVPVVTAISDVTLAQNDPLVINIGAVDPDDADLWFDVSFSGFTDIFGETLPTISNDGQITLNAVTFGSANITVTVMDDEGAQDEFTFAVNVPFEAPTQAVPDDFDPFSGQRQLSNTLPSLRTGIYAVAPAMTIDTSLNYQGVLETADGEIRFDLFAAESPITVNNFVNLAEDGFFDGLTFHRVLENFVAQGGDPNGLGNGGPGYQFVDEVDNGLSFNGFGQLAMANSGPNTNGSQFFFTLNDNPAFAGQHTIFGEVISGEDVLRAVNLTGSGGEAEVIQRVRIEIV